jgi:glutathione synthase/RimK-type ligase-like ATP-grasp enzyme
MKTIFALTDYKDRMGSKHRDYPYRSGMDKELLAKEFLNNGYALTYCSMADINLLGKVKNAPVIYTSQEDADYHYKGYIEDIVFNLESNSVNVIPDYRCLRANNNKVYMEMMRQNMLPEKYQLKTHWFGTIEEAIENIDLFHYPVVIKSAGGATSSGVRLADNKEDFEKRIKEISRSKQLKAEIRDIARAVRHRGYRRESLYRNKFIVQEFVPGLKNDWKLLIYHDKYYVLRRDNRPGDFRASGSGLFSFDKDLPVQILDAGKEIKEIFDVPMISIDLALSEGKVILIEFQFLYFGTTTLEKSDYYYTKTDDGWEKIEEKPQLEREYARAIAEYLKEKEI